MGQKPDLDTVSNDDLRRRLTEFLRQSRCTEADLISHIAEFDARRLYAREAASSMFAWCTEVLHLSEHEAYLRITVARASREHPILLAMLRDGKLHLSGICKLAPHLTRDNCEGLLERAEHRSKRQIEELIASLAPSSSAPAVMRKLPVRQEEARRPPTLVPGSSGRDAAEGPALADCGEGRRCGEQAPDDVMPVAPELGPDRVPEPSTPRRTRPALMEPVAPAVFRVRFDASAVLRDKLERLQALMRSSVPDGDLGKIIDVAVTKELERLDARRFARTKKPRKSLAETDTKPKSRHIPAPVRRIVEKRDESRCTYKDKQGRRCTKRHDLEFHHRRPFGLGGDHSPEGLALMCRTHNALLAEQDFGKEKMARYRRRASRVSGAEYGAGDRSGVREASSG